MKIVHIHLLGPYTDNWGYQENILPEVQARQGNEVTVIASCHTHRPDNSIVEVEPKEYEINGVKIIRIQYNKLFSNDKLNKVIFHYPVMKQLEKLKPDILLLHGLGRGITNLEVKRYIKHNPNCKLFGDVHEFVGNTGTNKSIKSKLVGLYYAWCRRQLYPYYKSVLCITQQCFDYAEDVYKIPKNKLQIFPLGFDPLLIDLENKDKIRQNFRNKYGIGQDEIVIAHGGKIIPRRKTEMAVQTICSLNRKVRLIVFGAVDNSIKEQIYEQFGKCDGLIYLNHLSKQEYIEVFLASDIAFFPGGQSSIWEEAIGCGLPLLVNVTEIKDASHYNRGGNIIFSDEDSVDSFIEKLNYMIEDNRYNEMAKVAITKGRDFFSYENISLRMLKRENER